MQALTPHAPAIPQRPVFRSPGPATRTNPNASYSVASWEPVVTLLLCLLNLVTMSLITDRALDIMNVISPLILTAILAGGALSSVLREPDRIWTPLFWFRVSTGVYFGIGSVVPFITNDVTRTMMNSFYESFGGEVAKLNLLVSLGAFVVLVMDFIINRARSRAAKPPISLDFAEREEADQRLVLLGVIFLLIGEGSDLLVTLFHTFAGQEGFLPGYVQILGLLGPVGIYMFSVWCFTRRQHLLPIAILSVLFEIVLGLIIFQKSTPMLALLMFLLAWVRSKPTLYRSIISVVLMIIFYATITPIVSYTRWELQQEFSTMTVTAPEAVSALLSYTPERAASMQAEDETQGALARISYTNAATFVVNQYDSGLPGDSYENWAAVFIPRFLWPDKPEMTGMGREVTILATGTDTSQTGIGVFAEGYWNFGWFGTLIAMIPIGLILSVWTRYSMDVMRRGRWFFFPVVLFGMKMGTRADGNFVPDFLGTVVIAVGLHFLIAVGEYLVSELRGVRAPLVVQRFPVRPQR